MKIVATYTNEATPLLAALLPKLEDPTQLNKHIAGEAEVLTANHLINVKSEHKTASRLGATPTYYFQNKSRAVESWYDETCAEVVIPTGEGAISNLSKSVGGSAVGSREAFAPAFGAVNIVAINSRYLTIPAAAVAYGRRAGEFPLLQFIPFASGAKALAMVTGKGKERKTEVYYWLREEVNLKEDKTILPTDDDYAAAAERGAESFMSEMMETTAAE
ncbi:hypothetical protein [Verrucomicrobium spinosum]|uniref:hypothetical protein n=1 Tax=Verrucomicrobium spinosum TaxID=2736 RepID=UPI00017452D6|nr:hypothetical protein [Verrucomicrobium spinosum]